jgi:hypothetical protein
MASIEHSTTFRWTGTHVSGSTAAAVVRYHGPTNTRGSRWIATVKRGGGEVWRASVPFQEGPLAAAVAAVGKFGATWSPVSCHSIDPDTYCVGF